MNKELTKKFAPGHATCAGCGIPAIVRNVLNSTNKQIVAINATGCLEVTSTLYPYTSWKIPYIHNAFENAGATAGGVEVAYKILKKRGIVTEEIKFIVFAGDGGTFDIGLQSLSGMLERGHDVLYVVYDNEGYMNTGGQRSGATPKGANMTTTPVGDNSFGNELPRKDIVEIAKAHHIPYVAQANVAYVEDLKMKAEKAFNIKGPKLLSVLQPCTNVWKFPTSDYVKVGKLATQTNYWPLYEIEDGKYRINLQISKVKPIEEYLKIQKRFRHLLLSKNSGILEGIKKDIDEKWNRLLNLAGSQS